MIDALFCGVRPIQGQEDIDAVKELCARDGTKPVAPTHVFVKQGKVVGYCSLAYIPMTFCHFGKEDMGAEDTFSVINIIESVLQSQGRLCSLTPVENDSPFYQTMSNKKMGYEAVATNVTLFVKQFVKGGG